MTSLFQRSLFEADLELFHLLFAKLVPHSFYLKLFHFGNFWPQESLRKFLKALGIAGSSKAQSRRVGLISKEVIINQNFV
jgi:hypothetical protein